MPTFFSVVPGHLSEARSSWELVSKCRCKRMSLSLHPKPASVGGSHLAGQKRGARRPPWPRRPPRGKKQDTQLLRLENSKEKSTPYPSNEGLWFGQFSDHLLRSCLCLIFWCSTSSLTEARVLAAQNHDPGKSRASPSKKKTHNYPPAPKKKDGQANKSAS